MKLGQTTVAASFGSMFTAQEAVNVRTVLLLMFAIVREVTATGQTSTTSPVVGLLLAPEPPKRLMMKVPRVPRGSVVHAVSFSSSR